MIGRERRRTDLYGRLRRAAYGLMIFLGLVHPAAAQNEPGAVVTQTISWQDGGRFIPLETVRYQDGNAAFFGERLERVSLSQASHVQMSFGPINDLTLAARFVDRDIKAARYGVGVNVALPVVGEVYLDLYSRPSAQHAGHRWDLNSSDATVKSGRSWSVGGTAELAKTRSGGREIGLVPQLTLDLDQLTGAPGRCEVRVQYAHWTQISGEDSVSPRTAQVSVNWKF